MIDDSLRKRFTHAGKKAQLRFRGAVEIEARTGTIQRVSHDGVRGRCLGRPPAGHEKDRCGDQETVEQIWYEASTKKDISLIALLFTVEQQFRRDRFARL